MKPSSAGAAGGLSRRDSVPSPAGRRRPISARPTAAQRRRSRRRGIPRTLYLYLASEVLQVFAVALMAFVLVYLTVIAFQLVRDGIRLGFLWPHLLRILSYPLFFSIPLALLIGVTLGIGRMSNEREMSALRAQGISHLNLALTPAVLGIVFSIFSYYLNGWVLPEVHYEQANLRETILNQLDHLGKGTNRSLLLPGNASLWVKRYDGSHLWGIVLDIQHGDRSDILPGGIFLPREDASASARSSPSPPREGDLAGEMIRKRMSAQSGKISVVAREASLEVPPDKSRVILWLSGVDVLLPEEVSGPRGRDVFHQKFSIDKLPLPLSFARRGESAKDMSSSALSTWIRELRSRRKTLGGPADRQELASLDRRLIRAEIEYHSRLSFSLACLTFPLVAFGLVMVLEHRSRLTHFFLGNLMVVTVFFPLLMAGQVAAENGFPAVLALALPNLTLAAVGGMLFRVMLRR